MDTPYPGQQDDDAERGQQQQRVASIPEMERDTDRASNQTGRKVDDEEEKDEHQDEGHEKQKKIPTLEIPIVAAQRVDDEHRARDEEEEDAEVVFAVAEVTTIEPTEDDRQWSEIQADDAARRPADLDDDDDDDDGGRGGSSTGVIVHGQSHEMAAQQQSQAPPPMMVQMDEEAPFSSSRRFPVLSRGDNQDGPINNDRKQEKPKRCCFCCPPCTRFQICLVVVAVTLSLLAGIVVGAVFGIAAVLEVAPTAAPTSTPTAQPTTGPPMSQRPSPEPTAIDIVAPIRFKRTYSYGWKSFSTVWSFTDYSVLFAGNAENGLSFTAIALDNPDQTTGVVAQLCDVACPEDSWILSDLALGGNRSAVFQWNPLLNQTIVSVGEADSEDLAIQIFDGLAFAAEINVVLGNTLAVLHSEQLTYDEYLQSFNSGQPIDGRDIGLTLKAYSIFGDEWMFDFSVTNGTIGLDLLLEVPASDEIPLSTLSEIRLTFLDILLVSAMDGIVYEYLVPFVPQPPGVAPEPPLVSRRLGSLSQVDTGSTDQPTTMGQTPFFAASWSGDFVAVYFPSVELYIGAEDGSSMNAPVLNVENDLDGPLLITSDPEISTTVAAFSQWGEFFCVVTYSSNLLSSDDADAGGGGNTRPPTVVMLVYQVVDFKQNPPFQLMHKVDVSEDVRGRDLEAVHLSPTGNRISIVTDLDLFIYTLSTTE